MNQKNLTALLLVFLFSCVTIFILNTSVYAASLNAPELIAKWHFDEPTGTRTITDTISGLVGTLHGNAAVVSGRDCFSGNCLHLDGDGDYVLIANHPKFNVRPDENLIVKIRFRTAATVQTMTMIGNSRLWQQPGHQERGNGWFLGFTYADEIDGQIISIAPAFISDSGPSQDGKSASVAFTWARDIYQDNRWHTYEALLDNLNLEPKSIIDGIVYPSDKGGTQYAAISIMTDAPLVIGANATLQRYFFNGYLDEVEIYKQLRPKPTQFPSPRIPTATLRRTPTTTTTNSPSPKSSPTPEPLMCIDSRCTSSTGVMNYGSVISCEMSATGGLQRGYEGVCNIDRNGITLESITLTPISAGASQFLPFTLTHGKADLNCKFRVCDVAGGQNQNCTTWGSSS